MLIIPAVDIKDGRCVRLFQGDMDRETIYNESPLEAARHWGAEGASILHVVDLNGAVQGNPVHGAEVAAICREGRIAVQLGGGIRSINSVEQAMASGVYRVVIGTAAYTDRAFLQSACKRWPGQIAVGIDARGGRVALKGWKEDTDMDAMELAKRCEADGATRIIYTDITRDGTKTGVNLSETRRLAQALKIPVIASGGVATLNDIYRVKEIEGEGVEGIIVGQALYTRSFTLSEAIFAANSKNQ